MAEFAQGFEMTITNVAKAAIFDARVTGNSFR